MTPTSFFPIPSLKFIINIAVYPQTRKNSYRNSISTVELYIYFRSNQMLECDHEVAFEEITIFGKESKERLLEMTESLSIKIDKHSYNRNFYLQSNKAIKTRSPRTTSVCFLCMNIRNLVSKESL